MNEEYQPRNLVLINGEVVRAYPSNGKAPSRFTVKVVEKYDAGERTSYISMKTFDECPAVGAKVKTSARVVEGSYEKDGKKVYTTDIITNKIVIAEAADVVPTNEEFDAACADGKDPLDEIPF